nr:integrase, catalytic region, zinc finger, CCHC-type, peptidase aspartic, catalytic [Tanacetum cinerariifolium]
MKNDNVIASGMFRINPSKPSMEEKYVPNKVKAIIRTNLITVSQPHVITKKDVNSDSNGLSSTGVNTSKTRRPQPRSNTKNDRAPSTSKSSCSKNKEVEFYDLDLEVAFRRNTCFIRNLEGVDLLKGNCTTNLYTINLYEMAFASPICLMARVTSTKSWLWHQRLSHLNCGTINDLAKNNLVIDLPKFKYHKEHLCPSCKQGKSKRASHPPKPIPNSKQRLHLLHMDLYCPMRITSINGKLDISFLHVFGALYYPKNDRKDIGKLSEKDDIIFFIGYFANSRAYRVYNRRTKKIIETINVTFDELSAMAFEQSSSKPGLQGMTYGQISLGLDLTYAPSTITTQQPTKHELDLLFEAMYDDYINGQLSAAPRTTPAAQAPLVRQTPTTSTTIADTTLTPTNSSSQATNIPNSSHDVDRLETQQQHAQQQKNQAPLQAKIVTDKVPNDMLDGNTFVNPFSTLSTSAVESSSSQYVDPSNMHTFYQPYPHEYQWTKDHPLEQVMGEPSRPILTRNQLRSDGDMYMYALTLSTMEPMNVKEAMIDPAWIESMQEELVQLKSLDVWVLVPAPDNIKSLTLKWLSQSGNTSRRLKGSFIISREPSIWVSDTFKSTSGGAQFLGEKLVSWSSKKQYCMMLSTMEAEYVSLSACCAQVIWLRTQLTDYGYHFNKIPIYCDSKSAIAISYNPV